MSAHSKEIGQQAQQDKALFVFQQLVFVRELTSNNYTYRITFNNAIQATSYLGLRAFRVGMIFSESHLSKILKKYHLSLNDINVSNRP